VWRSSERFTQAVSPRRWSRNDSSISQGVISHLDCYGIASDISLTIEEMFAVMSNKSVHGQTDAFLLCSRLLAITEFGLWQF